MARTQLSVLHRYWATILCSFFLGQPANAQSVSPSQVTPEVSPNRRLPEKPVIEQSHIDASTFAFDNNSLLMVGDVSVKFDKEHSSEDIRDFTASLSGQRVPLKRIIDAANDLERKFHAQGFILTRVVFPPQTFEDGGLLKVEVIDGFIERIDSSSLSPDLVKVIEARLGKLLDRPGLRLADIERALMVANETSGLRLLSALSQGSKTGGVLLTVESSFTRTTRSFQIDNYLPASLGSWQFGASIAQNNILGLGDSIYARLGGDGNLNFVRDRLPGFGYLGAGLSLPIDTDGSSIAFDAIVSRSSTEAGLDAPAINGRLTRASLRLNFLPVLNRSQRQGVEVVLESIRQSLEAADFGVQLTRDDYRVARLFILSDRVIKAGRFAFSAQLSMGLGGQHGGGNVPASSGLSRQGASPDFARLDAEGLLQVRLIAIRFDLTMRGQTSFGEPMLLSEQFSLDAQNAISTPVSGRFLVDSGQTSRLEAVAPGAIKAFAGLEPYVFAAQGYGIRVLPTFIESSSVLAGAFGVGARIRFGPIQLGLELGTQVAREFVTSWSEHARLTLSIR